jgi:putative transferase (TIGR04331 family)
LAARFLVTTALEDTWPDDDVPVLFLGDWCCLLERKPSWEKRDALIAPYHWDDRKKLHQDYLYLQELYEELLQDLVIQLNLFHRVDHSVRYWRLVVGPWLGYFIQMLFDRWAMLRRAVRDYDISGVRVLRRNSEQLIPNDMDGFLSLFIDDAWNESLYGHILNWMSFPSEIIVSNQSENNPVSSAKPKNPLQRLKSGVAKVFGRASELLCGDEDYFFIATYLGVRQNCLLQARLGQFPSHWRTFASPHCVVDRAARQWQLAKPGNNDDFAALTRALIPNQMPKAYLEGYRDLVSLTEKLPWPHRPKAIFTSNSFLADDVFKIWAAKKVESGTPLVVGQHGGTFGMALWCFLEDHQLAIADRFLTWGWGEPENKNIKAIGNFRGFKGQSSAYKSGVALLVEMAIPRQSYHMYSAPVAAGQWQAYFEEQCRFVYALPVDLRNQLLVRLYAEDYGYSQRQRWRSRFPDIRVDVGVQPMAALLKKSRIYISTYNATTFLESLSVNFPTIIFWNPMHSELRESAIPFFEKLKSVGIFHETPESAARLLATVWDDIPTWWQSSAVQSARQEFCDRYSHIPETLLDEMEKLFRNIAKSKSTKSNTVPFNVDNQ